MSLDQSHHAVTAAYPALALGCGTHTRHQHVSVAYCGTAERKELPSLRKHIDSRQMEDAGSSGRICMFALEKDDTDNLSNFSIAGDTGCHSVDANSITSGDCLEERKKDFGGDDLGEMIFAFDEDMSLLEGVKPTTECSAELAEMFFFEA